MNGLGQRLRERAGELGRADAVVAERLGLSQQRYHNYVSNQTEPDYETLLRICRALDTTPNAVLGTESPRTEPGEAEVLHARITATVNTMAAATLRIAAAVVDVLAREHGITAAVRSPRRKKEGS